jgi:hypothetical protein
MSSVRPRSSSPLDVPWGWTGVLPPSWPRASGSTRVSIGPPPKSSASCAASRCPASHWSISPRWADCARSGSRWVSCGRSGVDLAVAGALSEVILGRPGGGFAGVGAPIGGGVFGGRVHPPRGGDRRRARTPSTRRCARHAGREQRRRGRGRIVKYDKVAVAKAMPLTYAACRRVPSPSSPTTSTRRSRPELRSWLVRLRLLEGVPFANLVADTELLPAESMRWFYLDRRWTDALVQGALSVGTVNSDDRTHLARRSTPRSGTSSTSRSATTDGPRGRLGSAAESRR